MHVVCEGALVHQNWPVASVREAGGRIRLAGVIPVLFGGLGCG